MEKFKILCLLIALAMSACKVQQNTFTKVLEKEIPETPTRFATMKPDGSYIFGMEQQKKSGIGVPSAFVVEGEKGNAVWSEKPKKLGNISAVPERVNWIWPENKALFMTENFGKFKISCIDLTSSKELWSFEDNENEYSFNTFYIPSTGGVLMATSDGMKMIDLGNGQITWHREDINVSLKTIPDIMLGTEFAGVHWRYLPEKDKIIVTDSDELFFLEPASGESIWSIKKPIGSLANADLYPEENLAVFYGPTDDILGESIVRSAEIGGIAVGDMAMDLVEGSLVKEDVYLIDLISGKIKWNNKFFTNGAHQPILLEEKLIMAGIALNVYNRNTGEVIWQNIDQNRFEEDKILQAMSFLTGLDLSVGQRQKPQDLIFDDAVYAFYPEVLDNPVKENKISLRKYDLETGEEIWKSETEKIDVDYYFGAEGVLFLVGQSSGFIPRPILIAYDALDGSKLYEKKLKSSRYQDVVVENGTLYILTFPWDLQAFELRSGTQKSLSLPGRDPFDIVRVQGGFLVYYDRPGLLAYHNGNDFSIKNQVELPTYFRNHEYRGNTFFLLDLEGDPPGGIVAIDLEHFAIKGYMTNKQEGSATTTVNGQTQNAVYKDYHLFLTEDGEHIYEIDKDVLKKYRVN